MLISGVLPPSDITDHVQPLLMNGMVQKLEERLLILQDWQQPNQSSVVKRSLTVQTKSHNSSTIRLNNEK
jgi:hypothetical protein